MTSRLITLIQLLLPQPLLAGLVMCIAFLYASVGFGGASGYLAAMSMFDIGSAVSSSTALILNVIVAGIAFYNFTRHGYLQPRLLWPLVITSVPAAFLGGVLKVSQVTYQVLLNSVLLYVAFRLFFSNSKASSGQPVKPPPLMVAAATGAVLGLLSGILGIGGGIFLSPVILLAGWGDAKQAAASSAGFILINSLAGLAGRAIGGTLEIGSYGGSLIIFGIAGGLTGSYLGARYLSGQVIRRLLAVILFIAVGRFLFVWLG